MDRRLFIIHSADIVRKGLHAILRPSIPGEIILLSSLAELNKHESLSLESPVLVMEYNSANSEKLGNFFRGKVNFIHIPILPRDMPEKPPNGIKLNDSGTTICDIVKKNWEVANAPPDNQTTEELTQREREVLELVALGHSNKEIADKLHISTHTVISHRKNITEKLGIKSISGLTVYAIINNIIDTSNVNTDFPHLKISQHLGISLLKDWP